MKVKKIRRKRANERGSDRPKTLADRMDDTLLGGCDTACVPHTDSEESSVDDIRLFKRRVAYLENELADVQAECDEQVEHLKRSHEDYVLQIQNDFIEKHDEARSVLKDQIEEQGQEISDLTAETTSLTNLLSATKTELVAEKELKRLQKDECIETQRSNQVLALDVSKMKFELQDHEKAKADAESLNREVAGLEEQLGMALKDLSSLNQRIVADKDGIENERRVFAGEVSHLRALLTTAEDAIKNSTESSQSRMQALQESEKTVLSLRNEVASYQQELILANGAIDDVKFDLEREKEKVVESERVKDVLSKKVLQLEDNVTDVEAARQEALVVAEEKSLELQDAMTSIETSQSDVVGLTDQLASMQEELWGTSRLAEEQEEKLMEFKTTNDTLSHDVGELQRQLEETIDTKQSEIDATVEQILAKESALEEATVSNNTLSDQVKRLQDQLSGLQSQFDDSRGQLMESQQVYQALRVEISDLEGALDQQVKTSSSDLDQAIAFRQAKESEMDTIERTNVTLRESIEVFTERLATMEEELENSTSLCSRQEESLHKTHLENELLQQQIKELTMKLEGEMDQAKTELMLAKSELEQVHDDKDSLLEETRSVNDNLSKEVKDLQNQLGDLHMQVNDSYELSTVQSKEIETAGAKEGVLRSLVNELKRQLEEASAKAQKDLYVVIKDKTAELEEAEFAINELRDEVTSLQEQLDRKQEELDTSDNVAMSANAKAGEQMKSAATELVKTKLGFDTLKEQLSRVQEELDATKSLCAEQKEQLKQIYSSEKPVSATARELEESKLSVSMLTAQLALLQEEKESAMGPNDELLASKQTELDELNEQIDISRRAKEQLRQEMEEVELNFQGERELMIAPEQFSPVKEELKEAKITIATVMELLNGVQHELNETKTLCDEKQKQLDQAALSAEPLRKQSEELQLLQSHNVAAEESRVILVEPLDTNAKSALDETIVKLQTEVEELSGKLKEAEATRGILIEPVNVTDSTALDETIVRLQTEVEELQLQLQSHNEAADAILIEPVDASDSSVLGDTIAKLQTEVATLGDQLKDALKANASLFNDNDCIRRQLNEEVVSAENVQSMQMLKEQQYRHMNEELTHEIARMKCQMEITEPPFAENKMLKTLLAEQKKKVIGTLVTSDEAQRAQNAKLLAYRDSTASLTHELSHIESKHDMVEKERQELYITVQELEIKIAQLTEVNAEHAVKRSAIAERDSSINQLQNQLGASQEEKVVLVRQIEQFNSAIVDSKQMEEHKQYLSGRLEAISSEANEYKERNSILHQEIGVLRSNLVSTTEVKEQQEKQLAEIITKFEAIDKESRPLREKVISLESNLDETMGHSRFVEEESKQVKARNMALSEELSRLRANLEDSINHNIKTKTALKQLEGETFSANAERQQSQTLIAQLQTQITNCESKSIEQLATLEEDKTSLVNQLNDLNVQRSSWQRSTIEHSETKVALQTLMIEKKTLESHLLKLQTSNKAAAQYIKKMQQASAQAKAAQLQQQKQMEQIQQQQKEQMEQQQMELIIAEARSKSPLKSARSKSPLKPSRSQSPIKVIRIMNDGRDPAPPTSRAVTMVRPGASTSKANEVDTFYATRSIDEPEMMTSRAQKMHATRITKIDSASTNWSDEGTNRYAPYDDETTASRSDRYAPASRMMRELHQDRLDLDEAAAQIFTAIPNAFSGFFAGVPKPKK